MSLVSDTQRQQYSRSFLLTLLALVFLGALFYDRLDWPDSGRSGLLAGEATYLMQAESLAYDFDLTYTREDFDRSLLARGGEPRDLELASGSAGRRIAFARPLPYALWLAPFVRLWPENGFAVANALLLAAAAVFAALTLEAAAGAAAAAWVAVLAFASVAWSYVFLATGDLFLMAVVIFAWGLVARAHAAAGRLTFAERRRRSLARTWLAAGVLLAIPLATEPLYGVLALAAFFAVPPRDSAANRGAFVLGLAASLVVMVSLQWWAGGGLHFFATSRFRFTPETGFPLVDFPAGEWTAAVGRFQALYFDEAPRLAWGLDARLWLWNLLYLAAGRNIGLLPYFAPLVLIAAGVSFSGFRRAIALAVVLWIVGIMALHPFNLYGGEGAVANRLFLPLYGAAWFLLGRRPRTAGTVAAVALAGVFLWRLWAAPWAYPISPQGGYRYVTAAAERILPFETSQRWIPANQLADHQGLKLLLLNDGVWAETRRERLMLDAERRARMVIASPAELSALRLDFGAGAPSEITLRGARSEERILLADGGISFRLRLDSVARRHPLWWTPERQWLYPLELELPRGPTDRRSLPFQLVAEDTLGRAP